MHLPSTQYFMLLHFNKITFILMHLIILLLLFYVTPCATGILSILMTSKPLLEIICTCHHDAINSEQGSVQKSQNERHQNLHHHQEEGQQ